MKDTTNTLYNDNNMSPNAKKTINALTKNNIKLKDEKDK